MTAGASCCTRAERFYPKQKRIVIPERLTVCGGVMLEGRAGRAG